MADKPKFAVGDKVLIHEYHRWGPHSYYPSKVTEITKSGRMKAAIGNLVVVFAPDGKEWGKGWRYQYDLMPFDQAKIDEEKRQRHLIQLRRKLRDTQWDRITDELVESIALLLPKEN